MDRFQKPTWRSATVAGLLVLASGLLGAARAQDALVDGVAAPMTPDPIVRIPATAGQPLAPLVLASGEVRPIDLTTALRLAGVQNPDLNVARAVVLESVALRMLAAARFLPTLNSGFNYDVHTGVLQQSNGNILTTNRSAVYVGAGANAVAAGTVNIPGVVLQGNLGAGIYAYLASRQVVQQREAAAIGVRNQVFLAVALAYSELIRAQGHLAIAQQVYEESSKIAALTASYAATGEGRQADADRAAAEQAIREANYREAEGDVLTASARLAQVINVDTSIRLQATDYYAVPMPIVPDPIPVRELIAIGLLQRPELAERRAAIRAALMTLGSAKILPFSPNAIIGFSSGGFGGGSNLVRPVFGGFGTRSDLDVVGYWSLLNMGFGNAAMINRAKAALQVTQYEEIAVLNRVRAEVAESYALTHARFAQLSTLEKAVQAGLGAFERDFDRIEERAAERGRDVLPIELLNSFRLLARSRTAYLDSIVDYNEAQFSLYVALGQPPANMLARPVPADGIAPSNVGPDAPVPSDLPPQPPDGEGPFAPENPPNTVARPAPPRSAVVSRTGPAPARREDPNLQRVALPR